MKNLNRKLQIEQLDKKFKLINQLGKITPSEKGWIFSIRRSLNMSLRQFGKRLNITAQSAKEIENREQTKSITLKSLSEAAEALDMKLVYGLVPIGKSINELIEKRAMEVAKQIVLRTSHSMSLEDQENIPARIDKAIKDKTEQIKNELPRYLWD